MQTTKILPKKRILYLETLSSPISPIITPNRNTYDYFHLLSILFSVENRRIHKYTSINGNRKNRQPRTIVEIDSLENRCEEKEKESYSGSRQNRVSRSIAVGGRLERIVR